MISRGIFLLLTFLFLFSGKGNQNFCLQLIYLKKYNRKCTLNVVF
jgi:hypothetical protein